MKISNLSHCHHPCCRHPAYSINGILGIPQATSDANDNLLKRKRDDDEDTRGEEVEYLAQNCHFFIHTFHTYFSHYDFIGQRGGGIQESSNPVHQLVPAASQCLGWKVGKRPSGDKNSDINSNSKSDLIMWDNMGTSGETGEIGGAGAGVDLTLPNHLPRGSRLPQLRSRHEPVHLRQSHTRLVNMLHTILRSGRIN